MARNRQRLTVIDCKRNPKGFRHSVHEVEIVNGKTKIVTVDVTYIDQILTQEWLDQYTKDPVKFLQEATA